MSVGALGKIAVDVYQGWATAEGTPTYTLIPAISENLTRDVTQIDVPILRGQAAMTRPETGLVSVGDGLVSLLDYNNVGKLLQAAFGTSGHIYTLEDDLDDSLKIVIDRGVSRFKVFASRVTEFEISSGSLDELVQLRLGLIGRDIEPVDDAFPDVSFTNRNPVTLKQGRFYVGNLTDDLSQADAVKVSAFSLTVTRNLATDIYSTRHTGHTDASYLLEPEIGGFREVTLNLTIPVYDADTFIDWKRDFTTVQALLTFVDGSEKVSVEIPQLVISEGFDPTTAGPERRTLQGTLRAYLNDDNANDGAGSDINEFTPIMSTITKELRLTVE